MALPTQPVTPDRPPFRPRRRAALAFGAAVPIATLGGMIGLGEAKFRLPALAGSLGYAARRAAPLNLLVSLTTLAAARTLGMLRAHVAAAGAPP